MSASRILQGGQVEIIIDTHDTPGCVLSQSDVVVVSHSVYI